MARKLIVEIIGDASSLDRAFKKASKETSKFGKGVEAAGVPTKKLGIGLGTTTVAAISLGAAVRASFKELADAQKATAQTEAVLQSTGYAARVTADDVDALSASLMNLTGIDDELIKSSENVLLTFRNIRNESGRGNDIFTQATRAVLDMSTALGGDLTSTAIRVGKALNDPVRGITALRRAGVQLTEAQEAQIRAFVKAGDTISAQKIILRELQDEFGGSAEAAGRTLPGQLNKLRENLLNLGGDVASLVTPPLLDLTDSLLRLSGALKRLKEQGADDLFKNIFGALSSKETLKYVVAGPFFDRITNALGITGASAGEKAGREFAANFGREFQKTIKETLTIELPAINTAGARGIIAFFRKTLRQPGTATPFLDLRQAQAEQTTQLLDDLELVRRRIAVLRGRLDRAGTLAAQTQLQNALNAALQSERQILATLHDQAAARRDARREAARDAAEARARARAAARAALEAHQFALLGRGPDGAEIIPNAASLQKRFETLRRQIRGTLLDSAENRKIFAGIARVFAEGLKNVTPAVRRWIDDVLDTIEESIDKRGTKLRAKWKQMSVDAFIRSLGLNLTPEQFAKLRAGLLVGGPSRVAPSGTSPAYGLAGGTHIGTVNVYGVQDVRAFENEIAKRQRSRPQVRRGAR